MRRCAGCPKPAVSPRPTARHGTACRPSAARARVLLADDNADMRDYMKRLLSAAGHQVSVAIDGQAALEAARATGPISSSPT